MHIVGKDNPCQIEVPEKHIYILTDRKEANEAATKLIKPLKGIRNREWFTSHFYYCLPLVIANQYGFIVTLETDTYVTWNGEKSEDSLKIRQPNKSAGAIQNVISHFGSGLMTVDQAWVIKTAPNVNLYVGAPPNYFVDGLFWMSAVVETDNLRNDFTFNIRVTRPHHEIFLAAGTPVGFFMPIPRYFTDEHQLSIYPEGPQLDAERLAMKDFNILRHKILKEPGLHYRNGIDVYGKAFKNHQDK